MSIRPLPRHVAEKIKSSTILTSLNDAASGLVKNSLDADAAAINIYLDYAKGGCTVEDNGIGIPPSEFRPEGGLGKPHHTSKFDEQSECHGTNGEFLAAVAALSLLSITSRHQKHHSHNSLSLLNSAVVSRHTPSLPEQRFLTFNHGTRVSVRDLFGSMPVRAKQRPASGDRVAVEKEWRRLLRDVVGLLLPWRNPVSVYMKETSIGLELRFRPPQAHKPGAASGAHNLVSRISRTLTQANLADASDAESWEQVGASAGGMSVSGCVSLNPVASRRCQFICLGIQPIPSDAGSDALYDAVNRVFANSSFALPNDDGGARGSKGGVFGQRPKRGVDRWPMFYFRIDVADRVEGGRYRLDQFLDQGHRVEAVADLLKAVCYEFLRKHQFQPRSTHDFIDRRRDPSMRGDSPSSRLSTAPTRPRKSSTGRQSPFDMWSRVKVGKPVNTPKPESSMWAACSPSPPGLKDRTDQKAEKPAARPPLLGVDGKLIRPPFLDTVEPTEANIPKRGAPNQGTRGAIRPSSPSSSPSKEQGEPEDVIPAATSSPSQQDKPSEWITDILKTWQNPVFPPVQPPIPRTYDDALHGCTARASSLPAETPSIPLQSRISRVALRDAEVISQVDQKFIFVKVPAPQDPSPALLVLIDQHAADERCRLEDLTRSYFLPSGAAASEPLPLPIRFEVPPREGALLVRLREHFVRWGISYSASKTEVAVFALPPSILERCRQEPRLLIELMRTEIWKVDERGVGRGDAKVSGGGEDWVRLFHGCPSGILDLLNSRACRSAIMFNDPLTKEECATLVSRLASCSFPFQCAHGRPSMVPVLDLGRGAAEDVARPVSYKSWLERPK